MSSKGGISGSTSAVVLGCCSPVSCVHGVEGVADEVDGVTFAASHAAFSALVSFCSGSYRFPVSPSYNFLGAIWNCSELVEVLSLVLKNSLCRTVWIIAARHWVGCLGGSDICTKGHKEYFMMYVYCFGVKVEPSCTRCKQPFSPLFCFGCLLVFLFLRVRSVRWFWGMLVRSFVHRDLC